MMEVVGMVDIDVTCVEGEGPELEEAVVWNYFPALSLKVRIGSNCCIDSRLVSLRIDIVERVGASWDHCVEEAAGL